MRGTANPEIALAPNQEAVAALPLEERVSPGRAEHILIVDDEVFIVQMCQEMLEGLGYRVTTRINGPDALETVRQAPESFHLVITDFVMPRMNGLELAREVMRLRPDLPVILFTGCSKGVSPENARELGLADYLEKPLRIGEMHRAVRRALDTKWPREVAGSA